MLARPYSRKWLMVSVKLVTRSFFSAESVFWNFKFFYRFFLTSVKWASIS